MSNEYQRWLSKINSSQIREIVEAEFSGNVTAARVGARMDVVITDLNKNIDNVRKDMNTGFAKLNRRFDRLEKHLGISSEEEQSSPEDIAKEYSGT